MRTQILKGASLAVALGVLTLSAPAPVAAAEVRANVPFSFTVKGKVLPAGTYNVSNNNSALVIRGFNAGAVTLGQHTESSTSTTPKLVFHRYGDEYILREVWMGSSGYSLPQTSRERELASGRTGAATASASFDRVEVAIQ